MEAISADTMLKAAQNIDEMTEEQANKTSERMMKEQPEVMAFLMAAGEGILNEDERQTLLFIGTAIWLAMSEGKLRLRRVTEDQLARNYDATFKPVKALEGKSHTDIDQGVKSMFDNYPQPEVLNFVMDTVVEEDEQGPIIREDNRGLVALFAKVVIDRFNE